MPRWKYAITGLDVDKTAKAAGRELDISHKHAREICLAIKGMTIQTAKDYLEAVMAKKQTVPFKRHKKKVGHRRGQEHWGPGRYPIKAAKEILNVLHNVEKNATPQKNLEYDDCVIIHTATHKARIIKRFFPRAHGTSTPKYNTLIHVEIAVEEIKGRK